MICPDCGYEQAIYDDINEWWHCPQCHGTGEIEVEQTNEEWFDSLTTEKKAKIIKMVINTCISCEEHKTVMTRGCLLRQNMAKNLLFLPCIDEDGIIEWLKEIHK